MKKVRCKICRREYTDRGSVEQVRKWLAKDNYAPCPIIHCEGQLEIVEE